MAHLTYQHFYKTGYQDCGNTFSPSDFDLDFDKTPDQIVDAELKDWDSAAWIEQTEDFEDLDPETAYTHWKDGWRDCAIESVKDALERKRQRAKDELELWYVYGAEDPDDPIETFESREEAVDVLARLPMSGEIMVGDGNGPHYVYYTSDAASDTLSAPYGDGISRDIQKRFREARRVARKRGFRSNPDDTDAAVDKYTEFHRYDPRRLEDLGTLEIPRRVRSLGAAKYVLYRSGKVDPTTLKKPSHPVDYIHEHDAGVIAYACDGAADTDVPKKFREVTSLVSLGKCLGFAMKDGTEAKGKAPLPDLACTPDGTCLLVIQRGGGKESVLAMMWGGALGVFARGIDG